MDLKESERETELHRSIRAAERYRTSSQLLVLASCALIFWIFAENISAIPTSALVIFAWLAGFVAFIGTEVVNLKILLFKAEYREWLREFQPDRWRRLNEV